MFDNSQAWIKRADEVLALGPTARFQRASEAVQFATSMLTTLYGPQSTQLKGFLAGQEAVSKLKTVVGNTAGALSEHAYGAIANAKRELESGLIVKVRVFVAGEVLSALVSLAKDTLQERDEGAKNVSAVLIAAAFEDLIRRMREEFAGVSGRPKLEEVIIALKSSEVLKGGQVSTALSYLPFRNDSLHADWDKVDRSQVQSCIGFVESLLVKHFS